MNKQQKRKAEALALIAVGMLIAYLLFFALNSEVTLLLILGFLVGLLFAVFLIFALKKYTAYTNENTQSESEIRTAVQSKVFGFLGIESNNENSNEIQSYIDKSVSFIKLLFSSMTIFSIFALCLSIAIYYSSMMQLEKIAEQNKLLCAQNALAETSNKVALYSIQTQRIELSLKLLRENLNVISQSKRKLNSCRDYTKSTEGKNLFATDQFYECMESNFNVLEIPLLRYQENEAGAYMSSEYMSTTSHEHSFENLQKSYDKLWSIRHDENYKTFDNLLRPFLSYMNELEDLANVTNSQINELTDQRLHMVSELNVSNTYCESIVD